MTKYKYKTKHTFRLNRSKFDKYHVDILLFSQSQAISASLAVFMFKILHFSANGRNWYASLKCIFDGFRYGFRSLPVQAITNYMYMHMHFEL